MVQVALWRGCTFEADGWRSGAPHHSTAAAEFANGMQPLDAGVPQPQARTDPTHPQVKALAAVIVSHAKGRQRHDAAVVLRWQRNQWNGGCAGVQGSLQACCSRRRRRLRRSSSAAAGRCNVSSSFTTQQQRLTCQTWAPGCHVPAGQGCKNGTADRHEQPQHSSCAAELSVPAQRLLPAPEQQRQPCKSEPPTAHINGKMPPPMQSSSAPPAPCGP